MDESNNMSFSQDYLLNKKIKIFQPVDGYRASIDAVFLSSLIDLNKVSSNAKILDVGSGTGAVSLCLAYRLQEKNPQITGLDIQDNLVSLSNQSAKANGFSNFLKYEQCDIRGKVNLKLGSYDFVLTNPPYSDHDMPSPNESKKFAHNLQDFNLTSWLSFCLKMLKPKGYIALINRTEALNEILAAMYNKAGHIQILPLYSKQDQEAKRILIVAQKQSKGPTTILPPLYTHNEDGKYSEKAEQILRHAKGYFEL